jgi:PAS domain-containing protein
LQHAGRLLSPLRGLQQDNEATVSSNRPSHPNHHGAPLDRTAAQSKAAVGIKAVAGTEATDILASVGDALYHWDIESDVLSWSANAGDVLLIHDPAAIATGRAYAQLVEKDNSQARFEAVMRSEQRDGGRGISYRIQYCIRPDAGSDKKLWIEDTGRWFAGHDGNPARAHGVVRVINERYESERRLNYLARYDSLTGELNRPHLT